MTQTQAAFVAHAREVDSRKAEMDRENKERFARIESLLLEHNRILQELPQAIKDKMGFKEP